jgi:RHS repeat-associated protein
VTSKNSGGTQVGKTTYAYDPHSRQYRVTDARNGTATTTYNAADLPYTVTTPAPGTGQPAQTTTTYYSSMLQATNIVYPDGTSLTNEYWPSGLLKRTYGSRSYAVGYGYDAQGRMTKMTNWSTFNPAGGGAGERVTTWFYSTTRGWLDKKVYAGETDTSVDYQYWPSGRLYKRYWERGTNTTYTYNYAGELQTIDYSDSTPDVSYTYDRRGRQKTVLQNGITTTFHYDHALLLGESYSGGTLNNLRLTNVYDAYFRRTTNAAILNSPSSILASNVFGYDTASRLLTVTDGTNNATYGYLANSPLVGTVTCKSNTTTRMTTTRQYDFLNRLQSISSAPSGASPISFGYLYNDANQRIQRTESDASRWAYEYDKLGQVTSGKRYRSDGSPVPGQQFEYGFDDIGNRTSTKAGGDANGANLRSATYTPMPTNTYSSRTVTGAVDVVGLANFQASVTVNSSPADYRRGEYFQELLTTNNGTAPVWLQVNVTAVNGGASSNWPAGYVFVPKTAENFTYDQDGNLTGDGRWTYTWDGENRLTRLVAATAVGPQQRIDFVYDWQGRRIGKTVWPNTGGTGTPLVNNRFLYDGWNLVAELNATNNAVIRRYQWGLDLSGSEQGAGGVGGLLSIYYVPTPSSCFVAYDGNGNVAGLVDVMSGTVTANYEYGPFAEPVRMSGTMAKANPFRFSTKYQDDETDLLYYGFRYCAPSLGRWLSRDAIAEAGGLNLYAFVQNASVGAIDLLGNWMSHVHLTLTMRWAAERFKSDSALAIAISDSAVDHGPDAPYPWATLSRHLKVSIGGQDSRKVWYNREFNAAKGYLSRADNEGRLLCYFAAASFGRGLHSWQDISAHRPYPKGKDWPQFLGHPSWWDDWGGIDENKLLHAFDWWWLAVANPPDHFPWFWRNDQYLSQAEARHQVVADTTDRLYDFEDEVRKSCVCRTEMLLNP